MQRSRAAVVRVHVRSTEEQGRDRLLEPANQFHAHLPIIHARTYLVFPSLRNMKDTSQATSQGQIVPYLCCQMQSGVAAGINQGNTLPTLIYQVN